MSLQFLEPACTLALQLFAVKTRKENSSWVASLCTKTPCYKLTITRDEPSVVCAFLLECAAVWGGFAGGPLHEEVVFVKGAFPSSGIQWLDIPAGTGSRIFPRTPDLCWSGKRGCIWCHSPGMSWKGSPRDLYLAVQMGYNMNPWMSFRSMKCTSRRSLLKKKFGKKDVQSFFSFLFFLESKANRYSHTPSLFLVQTNTHTHTHTHTHSLTRTHWLVQQLALVIKWFRCFPETDS